LRLAQTVIAGLVVQPGDIADTCSEWFGAAAQWALGTSPRVTNGVVGRAGATPADECARQLLPRGERDKKRSLRPGATSVVGLAVALRSHWRGDAVRSQGDVLHFDIAVS
jgi:hypothetical protein